MNTVISLLAIPSLFIAPFAAFVAWGGYKDGNARMMWGGAAVCAVTATLYFAAPKTAPNLSGNCYTAWDGRSNSTVCD